MTATLADHLNEIEPTNTQPAKPPKRKTSAKQAQSPVVIKQCATHVERIEGRETCPLPPLAKHAKALLAFHALIGSKPMPFTTTA